MEVAPASRARGCSLHRNPEHKYGMRSASECRPLNAGTSPAYREHRISIFTSQCRPPSEPGPERKVSSAPKALVMKFNRTSASCATRYVVEGGVAFRQLDQPLASSFLRPFASHHRAEAAVHFLNRHFFLNRKDAPGISEGVEEIGITPSVELVGDGALRPAMARSAKRLGTSIATRQIARGLQTEASALGATLSASGAR